MTAAIAETRPPLIAHGKADMRSEARIIIERGSMTLDGAGERIVSWQRLAGPLLASKKTLFGKEIHADVTTVAVEQVEFEVVWSAAIRGVSPRDRLVEQVGGGVRIYDLVATYEVGRRRRLRLIGSRRAD